MNARTHTPVLPKNTSPFKPGAFWGASSRPAKATTRYNILEDPRRNTETASPKPVNRTREPKAKDRVSPNVFAHINANYKTAPTPPITHKQNHKEAPTTHHNFFAHLATTTTETQTHRHENKGTPVRPKSQHSQTSNHTVRPKRASTRTLLRRSPIRKANINRAFVISQRLNPICSTTTDIAKQLYYISAGVVNNTYDIALLGVDAFKFFEELRRARKVIEHAASVKMGEGLRIAAGLRSKELRFMTPTEYVKERTASVHLKKGSKKVEPASKQLKKLEIVREEKAERRAG